MDLYIYIIYIYCLYCYFITTSFSLIMEDNRCCRQHHDFISSYIFVVGVFVIDKNTQNIWFLQHEKPLKKSNIFIDKTHSKRFHSYICIFTLWHYTRWSSIVMSRSFYDTRCQTLKISVFLSSLTFNYFALNSTSVLNSNALLISRHSEAVQHSVSASVNACNACQITLFDAWH